MPASKAVGVFPTDFTTETLVAISAETGSAVIQVIASSKILGFTQVAWQSFPLRSWQPLHRLWLA